MSPEWLYDKLKKKSDNVRRESCYRDNAVLLHSPGHIATAAPNQATLAFLLDHGIADQWVVGVNICTEIINKGT